MNKSNWTYLFITLKVHGSNQMLFTDIIQKIMQLTEFLWWTHAPRKSHNFLADLNRDQETDYTLGSTVNVPTICIPYVH